MIKKILSSIASTFVPNGPSNLRLNNTIIVIICCIGLFAITMVSCYLLLKGKTTIETVITYTGGLLSYFLSVTVTGKLVQKKIEGKETTNPTPDAPQAQA